MAKKRKPPKRRSAPAKALAKPQYQPRTIKPKKGKGTKYSRPKKQWLGWYFAADNKRLCYGDNRKIKTGIIHKIEGEPVMCKQGLHASPTVLDALAYAPGNILYRVALSGKIVHSDDKSVATERTYLKCIDAESILQEFARKCALSVIHLWDCPLIVREYLEVGDKTKNADAGDAARDAVEAAAKGAGWTAGWAAAAAWAAARAAAWATNGADAGDSARAAAWAAARAAAWAGAGADAAARDTARATQKAMLETMVLTAMNKQAKPRRRSQ
jgi:hypothetical protein